MKGLGNPAWKGLSGASLCHPTEMAVCLGRGWRLTVVLGASAGHPGYPGPMQQQFQQMFCPWLCYCSWCGAGGGLCRTRCRAARACGVISEQAGSLSVLLGAGWWGFHTSNAALPCSLQSGQFNEDMIPTVGFNMRKITKGNVTIKVRCQCCRQSPETNDGVRGDWWVFC